MPVRKNNKKTLKKKRGGANNKQNDNVKFSLFTKDNYQHYSWLNETSMRKAIHRNQSRLEKTNNSEWVEKATPQNPDHLRLHRNIIPDAVEFLKGNAWAEVFYITVYIYDENKILMSEDTHPADVTIGFLESKYRELGFKNPKFTRYDVEFSENEEATYDVNIIENNEDLVFDADNKEERENFLFAKYVYKNYYDCKNKYINSWGTNCTETLKKFAKLKNLSEKRIDEVEICYNNILGITITNDNELEEYLDNNKCYITENGEKISKKDKINIKVTPAELFKSKRYGFLIKGGYSIEILKIDENNKNVMYKKIGETTSETKTTELNNVAERINRYIIITENIYLKNNNDTQVLLVEKGEKLLGFGKLLNDDDNILAKRVFPKFKNIGTTTPFYTIPNSKYEYYLDNVYDTISDKLKKKKTFIKNHKKIINDHKFINENNYGECIFSDVPRENKCFPNTKHVNMDDFISNEFKEDMRGVTQIIQTTTNRNSGFYNTGGLSTGGSRKKKRTLKNKRKQSKKSKTRKVRK
jgi:hypothetical protein